VIQAFEDDCTEPLGWMSHGACRDTDPELFFPVAATGPALDQIAEAKAVCAHCPVLTDCLSYALETRQDSGVWGGTSEQERRAFRRDTRPMWLSRAGTAGGGDDVLNKSR
jgi:WhiB family transcriptional regulator, redox-sensing transcriptional regulator